MLTRQPAIKTLKPTNEHHAVQRIQRRYVSDAVDEVLRIPVSICLAPSLVK